MKQRKTIKRSVYDKLLCTLSKNSIVYKTLVEYENGGVIRPCKVIGSGRYIQNQDKTFEFMNFLRMNGFIYESGNDAPKGGISGNWITIQTKIVE